MCSIEKIKQKLKAFPQLKYEETSDGIRVSSEDEKGFEVGLVCGVEDGYYVYYGGWHEQFSKDEAEDAIGCFLWGLTDNVRLKVKSRGSFQYHWTVQYFEKGKWTYWGCVGLLWFPFWRKKTIRYFQNNLIEAPIIEVCENCPKQ
jgi:hypothetical protein